MFALSRILFLLLVVLGAGFFIYLGSMGISSPKVVMKQPIPQQHIDQSEVH